MRLPLPLLACFLALLMLAQPIFAAGGVSVIKTKESGTGTHLSADITYWCGENLFTVGVKDAGAPLAGVSVYLFYGDYSYQLLATNTSDGSGNTELKIVGSEALLKNMFVVRLEKPGYKTSETEFRINCVPGSHPSNQSGAGNNTQNASGPANATVQGNQSSQANPSNQSGQNGLQNFSNLPAQLPLNNSQGCIGSVLMLAGLAACALIFCRGTCLQGRRNP